MKSQKNLNLTFRIHNVRYNIRYDNKFFTLEYANNAIARETLEEVLIIMKNVVLMGQPSGSMHAFSEDIKETVRVLKQATRYIYSEYKKVISQP